MSNTPTITLCSIDPVIRDLAISSLLCDVPDTLVIRSDIDAANGQVRRVVYDMSGIIEDVVNPLEHACLSCALREDIVPTAIRFAKHRSPAAIVLALPVSAEPRPVVHALHRAEPHGIAVASVASTVIDEDLCWDLLGDDLLRERDLGLEEDDERSVGETLAHQLETSDIVLSLEPLSGDAATLLSHLIRDDVATAALHDVPIDRLLARRPENEQYPHGGLLASEPTGAAPNGTVWTLDLASWRPLHPQRLLDRIEDLGAGPLRGRGYFWLPTRPDVACVWDGAGGQLSIGTAGLWSRPASTRLVITGMDFDPIPLQKAFDEALLTDAELAHDISQWSTHDDGFDFWLGARSDVA